MTPQEERKAHIIEGLRRLRADDELFAAECLKIRTKQGHLEPFLFNKAQKYAHRMIEQQKADIGLVRAIILKGRQQGLSTYIGARFYKAASMYEGVRAFIMAHEDKATSNLYKMVRRYHDNNPIAPSTGATNAKELVFDRLDSGYQLATAGSKDTGRSATAQLLHASEFAFWQNADSHMAGLGNVVADMPGTEILIESTGNGQNNAMHAMWQQAEAGNGLYRPIFIPWFWQDEYRSPTPEGGLDLSDSDIEYMNTFELSPEQMAWRANKIATYRSGYEWLFDQEYPATPSLAFQNPTANPFISPLRVQRAATCKYRERMGALVIGCDPAEEMDGDRTAIVWRHGRIAFRVEVYQGKTPMQVAGMLAKYWHEGSGPGSRLPDAIFVDRLGIGAGIVSRLKELNVPVIAVAASEAAEDDELYANKRAEMWGRMREWFADEPAVIPNNAELIADLVAPANGIFSSNGGILLESKKAMAKRGIRSPDVGDALAHTFFQHVQAGARQNQIWVPESERRTRRAGY